jgi:Alw26I/Eco31I/Esp3I family type II restriction endonuclease
VPRQQRSQHQDFIDYEMLIVKHSNYATLPNKFGAAGEIKWVSPSDIARAAWWDKQKDELGLPNRAEVARKIHPKELNGYKPCQICGEKKSIYYVYPNKNTLAKINKAFPGFNFEPYVLEIREIIEELLDKKQPDVFNVLRKIFIVPSTIKGSSVDFANYIQNTRRGVSPGAMSNAPDRLDGFHTYNACCRSVEDTGRHTSNLVRYTQDRRAYENWAEGNWKLSNRLMGEYSKFSEKRVCPNCGKLKRITADHIGPISLGFTHRPKFNPLCSSCNSQKNNRMTINDVRQLLDDEKRGEQVISWHSKFIWDQLKNKVTNSYQALVISSLMRRNLHHVLIILSVINENGHRDFLLKYLHPEYSFKDYSFLGFDPLTGPKKIIEKVSIDANTRRNAERYVRISFEALEDYQKVENRNSKIWKSEKVDSLMAELLHLLNDDEVELAKLKLLEILKQLSNEASVEYESLLKKHLDEDVLQETLDSDSEE